MIKSIIDRHLYVSRQHAKQIHQICAPLFAISLVKYFSYNRYFRNRQWLGFYTDPDPVEISLREDRGPIFVDEQGVSIDSGVYFHGDLKEIMKTKIEDNIVEKFFAQDDNPGGVQIVTNGLLIIRKGKNYDESFYFSMLNSNYEVSRAYYFKTSETLKRFCLYFLHKGRSLITLSSKYRIPYAIPEKNNFFDMMFYKHPKLSEDQAWFDTKKFAIETSRGDVFLSAQELNCLRLIAQGFTYSELAYHMDLSNRTIESYVNNLKEKLNASSKATLAQYYRNFSILDG